MASCLIGLGANLGDRAAAIENAIDQLAAHADIELVAKSSLHQTEPVGGPSGQGVFLNAATLVETSLAPTALLAVLQEVEVTLGRERHERWDARTIDLDLLLYGNQVLTSDELTVPHPRMSYRRFVIEPAAEIAPEMVHPVIGWTLAELCDHLRKGEPYVAIAGPIGVGKSRLAERLAAEIPVRIIAEQLPLDQLGALYRGAADGGSASTDDPVFKDDSSTAGPAWQTEIEFLKQRTAQLDRTVWESKQEAWVNEQGDAGKIVTVSDYWFDQALAFARVWLPEESFAKFESSWLAAQATVVRPKLLVVLDAPVDQLVGAITKRGRPCEEALTADTVTRLRDSLAEQVRQGGHGPILSLDASDVENVYTEVSAAIAAMQ